MGLPATFEEVHAAARAALLRLNELLTEFPGEPEPICAADGASAPGMAGGEASGEENEGARRPRKLGKTDVLRSERVARSAVSRH